MTRGKKKAYFFIAIALIIAGSFILSISWSALIKFIFNYCVVLGIHESILGIGEHDDVVKVANAHPDAAFMMLFCFFFLAVLAILFKIGWRDDGLNAVSHKRTIQVMLGTCYLSSLFYCFFVFFINFKFGVITLALFFWPVLLWKMDKIKLIPMIAGSLISAVIGYVAIKSTVALVLLLPTIYLLATRTKNAISSRYSAEEKVISTKLSATQKEKISKSINIKRLKDFDWWDDIVEPELDEVLNAFGTVMKNAPSLNEYDYIETEEDKAKNGQYEIFNAVKSSLMAAQSATDLNEQLNSIKTIDPKFSQDSFLERVEKIFMAVTNAQSKQDISGIQAMLSDSLYEQLNQKITEQKNTGIRYESKDINVVFCHIIRAQNNPDFQQIQVMVNAKITEVPIDLKTNEVMNDEVKPTVISEVYTLLRRPSAKTLQKPGLLECCCPNCGAPIEIGQVTVCKFCNSYIRSGSYDWVLSQITQSCEWKYSNPNLIPGWFDLSIFDKHICIQQIEDKASVIFWMLKNMEQSRKAETMQRFTTVDNFLVLKKDMDTSIKEYTNFEGISLASVKLQAIEVNNDFVNLYLLVVWSGIPVK